MVRLFRFMILLWRKSAEKIQYLLTNLPNELILENEEVLEACLPWIKSLKLSCNVI